MQNDFIPPELQADFDLFLQKLEQLGERSPTCCPYCSCKVFGQTRAEPLTFRCKQCFRYFNPLTGTAFNRLTPLSWLAAIFVARVHRETYFDISEALECSVKMVTLRDRAIMQAMQTRFPDLYQWYLVLNDSAKQFAANELTSNITAQHIALKQKITEILTITQARCLYCDSEKTVKVGSRCAFRCNRCRRGFSLLDNTPIKQIKNADNWLEYIDSLVSKKSNRAIAQQFGLNNSTMGIWRRRWCYTMKLWKFDALASWCKR